MRRLASDCAIWVITTVVASGCAGDRCACMGHADALVDGLAFDVPSSCAQDRKGGCGVPVGSCEMLFDLDPHPGDLPRLEVAALGDNPSSARSRVAVLHTPPCRGSG